MRTDVIGSPAQAFVESHFGGPVQQPPGPGGIAQEQPDLTFLRQLALGHTGKACPASGNIQAAGCQVDVIRRSLCCGRPLYDYGMLGLARRMLRRTMRTLRPYLDAGVPVIGLEPSCVAVFRDELVSLFPNDPDARRLSESFFLLSEFMDRIDYQPPRLQGRAVVHGHCHHKSVLKMTAELKVLRKLGLDFEVLDSGCCGMAGGFGFEKEHYEVSMKVGERVLLRAVREAGNAIVIADGFSCREQIRQGANREALHLADVLRMALGQDGSTLRRV